MNFFLICSRTAKYKFKFFLSIPSFTDVGRKETCKTLDWTIWEHLMDTFWQKALVGICSGSTIVGVGDSEPPQFIYDEDKYSDVFVSGHFSAFL